MMKKAVEESSYPNYLEDYGKCLEFLQTEKYRRILAQTHYPVLIEIALDDLFNHKQDKELVSRVENNTKRYLQIFCTAIDALMPSPASDDFSIWDVLSAQRRDRNRRIQLENGENDEANENEPDADFPPALMRRYECKIIPQTSPDHKPVSLRSVRACHIGHLMKIRAMVTRVSDVQPLTAVATYVCDTCGSEVYQEVFSRQFNPLNVCPQQGCAKNRNSLILQTRGSRFIKYQEIRIQEQPDQVPTGHVPRTMTVHSHGELTRQCGPGDIVVISGIFLPTRFTGYRAMRAGLLADTYFEAQQIERLKKNYNEFEETDEMAEKLNDAASDPEIFRKLARSIAPEIYGHEDVKKALLLQLVGGTTRNLQDGMRIRGDINICLMGDPGVAKSQLLKYIASVAPRGVYTTGKGSSGVGLTAAVCKDPVTGDMALEGGALVLADMGVCCIDEFDKMEDSDRTAIHEVMEQQTVSIAKAGITTTLNARAAVLAAANPLYGRYNRNRPVSENINLPNSLISRFDLIFLLLDKPDIETDTALARHVTFVHRHGQNPELDFIPFHPTFIKQYISNARTIDPHVPPELASFIVEAYVQMRKQDSTSRKDQTAMTARQLLSILRLSQALARLRFYDAVTAEEVEEAIRLTNISKSSLESTDSNRNTGITCEDPISRIYGIIRDTAASSNLASIEYQKIEAMVVRRGYSIDQLSKTLEEYETLELLEVNEARTLITLNAVSNSNSKRKGEDLDSSSPKRKR